MATIYLGTTPNMEIKFHGSNVTAADIDDTGSITADLTDPSGNTATGQAATLVAGNPPRGRFIPSTSTIDEAGPWTLQFTVIKDDGGVFKSNPAVFDAE